MEKCREEEDDGEKTEGRKEDTKRKGILPWRVIEHGFLTLTIQALLSYPCAHGPSLPFLRIFAWTLMSTSYSMRRTHSRSRRFARTEEASTA